MSIMSILFRIWVSVSAIPRLEKLLLQVLEQQNELRSAVHSINDKVDHVMELLELRVVDHFTFTVITDGITKEDVTEMQLTDTQKSSLKIIAKDAKGNPATVTGSPTWATSDPTVCTVTADDPTGMTATLVAVAPGTARVTADDLEVGGADVTGMLDVTVIGGSAVTLEISAGAPAEQ